MRKVLNGSGWPAVVDPWAGELKGERARYKGDALPLVETGRMDGPNLMCRVVAGFEKSDMGPLFAAMHDEIVWKSANRHDGLFRFHGEYKTRSRVIELLTGLFLNYKFHRFEPKEIIASGDVVWGHFDVVLSFDPKGIGIISKDVDLEIAIRWRLKEGKIIEHQSFFDTASLLIQQTQLARPSALT